jgi:hypothetical protein
MRWLVAACLLFCIWRPVIAQQLAPFATPPPGSPPAKIVPYGQAGGCPEEPALFHTCALEKAKTFNPPRTPDGHPDFQGVWNRIGIRNMENIQEHPQTMDGSGGRSAIVDPADGFIPYQPWALARRDTHFSTYLDPPRMCLPQGAPRFAYGGGKQVVQTPGYVFMFNDQAHYYRIIPTDGRPHIGSNIRLFEGDSRGRWEGNTLVIDVTNFTPKTDYQGSRENLHLVERWTRTGPRTLAYEVTIEDPTVWTRPWTVKQEFSRQSEEENRIYSEPRCVEGNYGLPGLLHGRRVEDAAFAQGRGPDPATMDNVTGVLTTAEVPQDPLLQ